LCRLKLSRIAKKTSSSNASSSVALDITTTLLAYYPNFLPATIERMYVFLELDRVPSAAWDQALECAQRTLKFMPYSVDAILVQTLQLLVRDGGQGDKKESELVDSLFQVNLFGNFSYFRLCGKWNPETLICIFGPYVLFSACLVARKGTAKISISNFKNRQILSISFR
jgi:hypothetical protein